MKRRYQIIKKIRAETQISLQVRKITVGLRTWLLILQNNVQCSYSPLLQDHASFCVIQGLERRVKYDQTKVNRVRMNARIKALNVPKYDSSIVISLARDTSY